MRGINTSIHLPFWTHQKIKQKAKEKGISVNKLINQLIEEKWK